MIASIPTRLRAVALTFDDGPHETLTGKWIEFFAKENAHATFFELGARVKERPELARKLVEAGHEVGNHSMTHPHLPELDPGEIRDQLRQTQEVILEASGTLPRVFRAPFLDQDEKVVEVLAELGMPSIGGNRSTADWRQDVTVEEIISRSTDEASPGDIIILHTWQTKTFEAMPEILRRLGQKGLACVTVSTLLNAVKTDI